MFWIKLNSAILAWFLCKMFHNTVKQEFQLMAWNIIHMPVRSCCSSAQTPLICSPFSLRLKAQSPSSSSQAHDHLNKTMYISHTAVFLFHRTHGLNSATGPACYSAAFSDPKFLCLLKPLAKQQPQWCLLGCCAPTNSFQCFWSLDSFVILTPPPFTHDSYKQCIISYLCAINIFMSSSKYKLCEDAGTWLSLISFPKMANYVWWHVIGTQLFLV